MSGIEYRYKRAVIRNTLKFIEKSTFFKELWWLGSTLLTRGEVIYNVSLRDYDVVDNEKTVKLSPYDLIGLVSIINDLRVCK